MWHTQTTKVVTIAITAALMLCGCGTGGEHQSVAKANVGRWQEICDSGLAQLHAIARDTTFQPHVYARRLLSLGSRESAAALTTVIGELSSLGDGPIKMVHSLSGIGDGFEHIAAVAAASESRRGSEMVSRSEYAAYEALLDEAGVTCRNDASG
jgi:hypothetical protein